MIARVGGVRKAVAHDIERHRDEREDDGRIDQLEGIDLKAVLADGDKVAERHNVERKAEVDVAEKNLGADGVGDRQRDLHDDDADDIRHDVFQQNAGERRAETLGGNVVLVFTDGDNAVSHEARDGEPTGQTHGEHDRPEARAQNVGEEHQIDRLRDVGDDVVKLRHEAVDALHVTPQRARDRAERHVEKRDHKAQQQRGARAVPGARPHIAADVVRAEPVLLAGGEVPHGAAGLGKVRVAVARFPAGDQLADERVEQAHRNKRAHDAQQHRGAALFEEGAEGAVPVGVVGVAGQFALFVVEGNAFEHALAQRDLEIWLCSVHDYPSSFSVRRMRGSRNTIRISPRNTPSTPRVEYRMTST